MSCIRQDEKSSICTVLVGRMDFRIERPVHFFLTRLIKIKSALYASTYTLPATIAYLASRWMAVIPGLSNHTASSPRKLLPRSALAMAVRGAARLGRLGEGRARFRGCGRSAMAAARCGSKAAVPAGCVGARAGGCVLLFPRCHPFYHVVFYRFYCFFLFHGGLLRLAVCFFVPGFSAGPAGGGSPIGLLGLGGLRFGG